MAAAPTFTVIGRPIQRVEGPDKVTGRAHYTADIVPPNSLWAKNTLSPLPHARIVSIDTSRALKAPGVRAVLTAADIPFKRIGRRLKDYPVLAKDRVLFVGERVAVVAADSREAAEEGALLVDVEYEELPAVFDPLLAMLPDAPLLHPDLRSYVGFPEYVPAELRNVCARFEMNRGDLAEGFAKSDVVMEHTFTTGTMHQGFLEPHATVVSINEAGRVEFWHTNKAMFRTKDEISQILDLSPEQVRFHVISIGGDFGGKGAPGDAPAGYYLAKMTGRPIKFIVTSPEELSVGTPRHPAVITIKSGVMKDGTIVARDVSVIFNSGAYGGFRPPVLDGMLPGANQAAGHYDIPNVHIEGRMVYTNEMPRAYMRSPGQPQAVFAAEAHMDILARAIDMDPLEFRLKNAPRNKDGSPTIVPQLFHAAAEAVDWGKTKPPLVGRGIAIASRTMGGGIGTSDITVNPDGTVTAVTAAPDVGTGTTTVVAAVVAECWGITMDDVRLVRTDTDDFQNDAEAGASRMTNIVGHVAIAACNQVKEQLAPLAAAMLGSETASWARGGFEAPDGSWVSFKDLAGEMIKPGDPLAHARVEMNVPAGKEPERTVQAAEVEVDPETGQVRVLRMSTAQSVSTIINETAHQGQIDGCAVQGFGYALTEELAIAEGRVLTGHLGDYKMPTIADVPPLTSINVGSTGEGPFNAQAIGETGVVPTPAAIANAVADAIGVPVMHLPMSAERILDLLDRKGRT